MSIYTNPPEWEDAGKKPPSSKRTEGWKPGDKVPASWLNWFWYSTVNSLREIAQAFVNHRDASAPHDGHETPAGAQAKANAAEANAKSYTDTHAGTKNTHGVGSGYYIAKTSRSDQLPAWNDLQGKPSTFPPSSHTHSKSDVGLGNVQNYGIATQAQAEAGTDNNVYMTPLRVKEAIFANKQIEAIYEATITIEPNPYEGVQYTIPNATADMILVANVNATPYPVIANITKYDDRNVVLNLAPTRSEGFDTEYTVDVVILRIKSIYTWTEK